MHLKTLCVLDLRNSKMPNKFGYSKALVVLWPFEKTFWAKDLWLGDICQTKNFCHAFFFESHYFCLKLFVCTWKSKIKVFCSFLSKLQKNKDPFVFDQTFGTKKRCRFFSFQKNAINIGIFFFGNIVPQKSFCSKNFVPFFSALFCLLFSCFG